MKEEDRRKAEKHFRKTIHCRTLDDSNWTEFRKSEKLYKCKFPPPSLDDVLDLQSLLRGDRGPSRYNVQETTTSTKQRAFFLHQFPGLILLPSFLPYARQRELVSACLRDYIRLNETNLHTHYQIPKQGLWSLHTQTLGQNFVPPKYNNTSLSPGFDMPEHRGPRLAINNEAASLDQYKEQLSQYRPPPSPSPTAKPASSGELLHRLRWANLGYHYHWGTKSYDFTKKTPKIPDEVGTICKDAVAAVDWSKIWSGYDASEWDSETLDWETWKDNYTPEAGIINFYKPGDTLMGHVDRSEASSTTPLVSISLGRPAIFLIGGQTRDEKPAALLLRTGDLLIMSGPRCRRAYHGVPRILDDPPPTDFLDGDSDWEPFKAYISNVRINVNVRQVFPYGVDASAVL